LKYTIYKTTNKVNGKVYIGKHQTANTADGYLGSGKLLKSAIEKYGIENFEKEILHVFQSEEEMNAEEARLVTEEFCKRPDTYNLCPGGQGGFGHINSQVLNPKLRRLGRTNADKVGASEKALARLKYLRENDKEWQKRRTEKQSATLKKYYENRDGTFKGKTHTDQTKRKMSESSKGNGTGNMNSQFGTMWITDGIINKKIKNTVDIMPPGWRKGRILKSE
jgi:hypothetical protein